jgi:hypothetical protein
MKDFSVLLHPEKHNTTKYSLFWLNYITLHIPMAILGIYMFITKEYSISKPAFYIAFVIILFLFLFLDNKDNGVLKGMQYIKVALVFLIIWILIAEFFIFPGISLDVDPLIAPVLEFSWG